MVGSWMTYVILGEGKTSQSCQTYFASKNIPFSIESNLNDHIIQKDVTYVASPGIPFHHPLIQSLKKQDVSLISDIDLFLHECKIHNLASNLN